MKYWSPTRIFTRQRTLLNLLLMAFLLVGSVSGAPKTLAATIIPNVSATKDLSCLSQRTGSNFNCTAKEFTVNTAFSAANGTPPFCMANQEFEFVVDVGLSGSNANRYDIGFFVGQTGNDPASSTASQLCSVATFPTSPSPWLNLNGNACGDYLSGGDTVNTVDKIKVICTADAATNTLQIPYVLTYLQNAGGVCSGPANVLTDTGSKCQKGTATVSGVTSVQVGVWVDITKATIPSSSTQSFSYTATVPSGYKVVALTDATSLTSTGATGGTYNPTNIAYATNSTTFTLQNGKTARVFMTIPSDGSTQGLTITETAQAGWDPTASITCSGAAATTIDNANRSVTASLNASATSAACTITNTKRPTLTVKKISIGDIGSFTFSGTNDWVTQTITTTTSGVEATGTTQVLPQYVETILTENAVGGYRLDDMSCVIGGSPIDTGSISYFSEMGRSVTFDSSTMAPGAEITCTFTNVRRRTLQLVKNLDPVSDPGKFVLRMIYTGAGTWEYVTLSKASGAGGHNTSVSSTVDVTGPITIMETASTANGTNTVNYSPAISCNTTPEMTSSGSTNMMFNMPNQDLTCTFINTRKSASLILTKQWQVGIPGHSATVSSSGFTNNGTSGAVVADSTGNNNGSGTAFTVYSGESGTLSEVFNNGDANFYNASMSCTGTSGLSGAILTVQPIDTAIQCIITNARKSANLTVQKQWINSDPGAQVLVSSNGFINTATSGSSASGTTALTTGTPVLAYVGESGTFSETYTSGSASDYVGSVTCSGTSGFNSSTGTLTVGVNDTAITCTYANQAKKPVITVTKSTYVIRDPLNGTNNPKSIPGARVAYNIDVVNSGPGAVDANTLVISDVIPNNVKLYVGDIGGGSPVAFVDGSGANVSGLSWSYGGLSSTTDSLEFSSDGGISWNYVPTADAEGFDNNVSHIRFKPLNAMNAASGSATPMFTLQFQVGVK